ncbi:MAG: hypothetical protein ACRC0X_00900, partial [Brevinema sp.]
GRFTGNTQYHPYTWNYLAKQQLIGSTTLAWQLYSSEGQFGYERFINLMIRHTIDYLSIKQYRIESSLQFSPPVLPFTMRLYSSYDSSILSIYGSSILGQSMIPRFDEYSHLPIFSLFTFYGDIELLFYSWEIQQGIGFGEFFVHRWAFFGGYRAGFWDQFLQSVFLKTQFDFSILYGNLPLSTFLEANYAISINQWSYNIGLQASLPI